MKLFSFILLMLVAPMVTAQNLENQEKMLVGTWVFNKINFEDYLQNYTQNDLEGLRVYIPVFEEAFATVKFKFDANRNMITFSEGEESNSRWAIIDNGTVLSMTSELETEYMAIGKLNAKELELIIDDGTMRFGLCMKKQ